MKSNLTFLIASIAVGTCLVFSAGAAQELPKVFESLWVASNRITYDPLLVAAFILSITLAIGRITDIVREHRQRRNALRLGLAASY